MRNAFAADLTQLASEDDRVVLLSGDIGNRLFNNYKDACPGRFFNCGVAEANMIGVAAGLSLAGLKPVAYTIAAFVTSRCFEQIKIDLCYQNLPVLVVGVGSGISYANLGGTHHSFEDVAILRSLPNMTILAPGDAVEVGLALKAALAHPGPVYMRLGKKNEPVIHDAPPQFAIGQAMVLKQGDEVCLLNTGTTLPVALEAAQLLEQQGVSCRVVHMHTIKPLQQEMLAECFSGCRVVATLEEHSLCGGFGAAVAEWLADSRNPDYARMIRFGLPDSFISRSGSQANARATSGLTPRNVAQRVHEVLAG